MKVDISGIARLNGASMKLNFNEEPANREPVKGCVIDGNLSFIGTLTNINGIIHLEGRLGFSYDSECYRCLAAVRKTPGLKIREDFINSVDAEHSDMYPYQGKILDIGKALSDNIILNLPMKHLCSGQCKGLCSSCGANLNEVRCECGKDTIDPRMEGLNKYFERL